jgi:hypothetical protein
MPKDPTKNVDRYKIRGGTLNERELDENQEAYEKQKSKKGSPKLISGTPPEKANRASKTKNNVRGASAKKLAARKSAKKK